MSRPAVGPLPELLYAWVFHSGDKIWAPRQIEARRIEVEIVLSGHARIEYAGVEHTLESGRVLWHRSGDYTMQTLSVQEEYSCLVLTFAVAEPERCLYPRIMRWEGMISCQQFAQDLMLRWAKASGRQRSAIARYVYAALEVQAESAIASKPQADVTEKSIDDALALIYHRYSEGLTVKEIAQTLKLSISHLHHLFNVNLGKSPYQVLQEYRLDVARQLLSRSNERVNVIAKQCGFVSVSGFCRAYKKHFQLSPGQYRKYGNQ